MPPICDALALQRPILVAHSMGAAVCLHAVLRHPRRFGGLVLVSPPVYDPPPPPGLRFAKRHPGIARRFFASAVGRSLIPWLVRRAVFADGDAFERQRVDRMLSHLDAPGGWSASTTIGLRVAAPVPQLLSEIECPTLVCWGRLDRVHPVDLAQRLHGDLQPGARLAIAQDAGHNVHEERAEWFAEVVRSWLGSLAERTAG
jgi:pimeloyl-ACP methyl ester carboxylesterase